MEGIISRLPHTEFILGRPANATMALGVAAQLSALPSPKPTLGGPGYSAVWAPAGQQSILGTGVGLLLRSTSLRVDQFNETAHLVIRPSRLKIMYDYRTAQLLLSFRSILGTNYWRCKPQASQCGHE